MAKTPPVTPRPGTRPSTPAGPGPTPGPGRPRDRIGLSPSPEVSAYLDQLVRIGVHGNTVTEVVETLVAIELERLLAAGILRRPSA